MRKVLLVLAGLDFSVILLVYVIAATRGLLHLINLEILVIVGVGIGLVLLARVYMAVRLRPRPSNSPPKTSPK